MKTKEEILAANLGWDKYSEGPVMCQSTEILKAVDEYYNQAIDDAMEAIEQYYLDNSGTWHLGHFDLINKKLEALKKKP